jgi:cold-inducible RNA-binding protein
MTKLYVGNLSYSTNDQALGQYFSKYGNVLSAVVITDKMSGRSKGFGFVELEDDSMAQAAIKELNGAEIDGRKLNVSVARPMEERPNRR